MVLRYQGDPVGGDGTEFQWTLTRHVCRVCLGRVLTRKAIGGGRRVWRCTNCGIEREGPAETALCCCGIRLGKQQRDAGIRCVANPDRKPENMSEIVAMQVITEPSRPTAGRATRAVDAAQADQDGAA